MSIMRKNDIKFNLIEISFVSFSSCIFVLRFKMLIIKLKVALTTASRKSWF